ncbi:MAG: polysaccharide lyase family protein [Phycisphaerae bacterium]
MMLKHRFAVALLVAGGLSGCASRFGGHEAGLPAVAQAKVDAPVRVSDDGASWTLDNGIVKATINKGDGRMTSLVYHGINTMGGGGYWEETPLGAPVHTEKVTIDPATNGGARAEVAVKGVTNGTVMLTPGAPGGGTYCNIELRYAMGRGESGIYAYAIFSHPKAYRAMGIGESRYITKLNHTFNWISVDKDRNMLECTPEDWGNGVCVHAKEQRILSTGYYRNSVEHKYSYNAVQYKVPAFGWSSTSDHIGVWFINPTIEFLSGGASKQELVCHFDANNDPDPIILDYWRGTHYNGGASCNIAAGEEWSKVVGPIFVYCNALEKPKDATPAELSTLNATAGNPVLPKTWEKNATALWQDALGQAKKETAKWPYDWVNGVDYPHRNERANVTGQLVLDDPQAKTKKLVHLTVGLAHPDYPGGGRFGPRVVNWAHDAKFYQFWNDGSADGKFTITEVRPGNYTLHAFADGVLGEFAKADITVKPGEKLDLGKLTWTPVRYGKQVWEIGYPDRTGDKFYKGDGENYWLWGWGLRYPLLFPNDITYTIGKSDYHKDWFFQETPHGESRAWENPGAKDLANQRFGWVKAESLEQYPHTNTHGPWPIYGHGRATTWTIKFDMAHASKGVATLRVALAGADGFGGLQVGVNGQSVGTIRTIGTNSLRYNTNKSVWYEYKLPFDATKLKAGENDMTLTVPAGDLTSGVTWDYLRLELDEKATTEQAVPQ